MSSSPRNACRITLAIPALRSGCPPLDNPVLLEEYSLAKDLEDDTSTHQHIARRVVVLTLAKHAVLQVVAAR